MENTFMVLISCGIVLFTIIYIIKDIQSIKRIRNAEAELGLCSTQIKSFNDNVNTIQQRLTSIENRLSNVEHKVNTYNGCTILHD